MAAVSGCGKPAPEELAWGPQGSQEQPSEPPSPPPALREQVHRQIHGPALSRAPDARTIPCQTSLQTSRGDGCDQRGQPLPARKALQQQPI